MNGSKPLQPDDQPEPAEELQREIQRLQAENERLKKKIKDLEEELRASKRQAAPFSKGQRKANPKRPGRKAGQGDFRYRPAPAESIGGEIVEAAVPAGCPSCGGVLEVELRASKRQAAPFSKRQRKANPKPPGRKAGQGNFRYRPAPAESIGGEIVEAAVPAGCPSCG